MFNPFRKKNDAPSSPSEFLTRIQIGQQIRIDGSGPHHVAGRVVYEKESFTWSNFRLFDPKGYESWLSVEDWGEQGIQAVLYRTVEVNPMPTAPEPELYVAVKEPGNYQPHSFKVSYNLLEQGAARVAFVEEDDRFLREYQVEPVTVSPGDQFSYYQYVNASNQGEFLSFEIWGEEIYPSKGQHLAPGAVQPAR